MNPPAPVKSERVHHPFSPSKLQALEACPKYEGVQNDNPASAMGTAQHDIVESGEDNLHIPDAKAAAAVEAMKFVDERRALYPGSTLLKEIYLPIDSEIVRVRGPVIEIIPDMDDPEFSIKEQTYLDFEGTTAGYLDTAIISADKTEAEVIDFKFGQFGVEKTRDNLQGIAYMLGLKRRYPRLKRFAIWFFLPHRDEVDGCEFTEESIPNHYLRIKTVVARAIEANKDEDDYSKANVALGACLFCARLGKCPKAAEVILKVGEKYAPVEFPKSISTTVFSDPSDVARGLKLAQLVKTWAEAYRSQATAKTIDDPVFVPDGYDLVPMVKRSVKDAKALGNLAKRFLPDDKKEEVEKLYSLAIGDLEEMIALVMPRGQKEKTVEEFGKLALDAGYLVEGNPFAFLRQSRKKKETTQTTKGQP